MSIRYKDTEYTYISAKVRAMEKELVGRDCLERMISADSTDSAAAYLREYGLELSGLSADAREDVLIGALLRGLTEIEKNAPNPEMFAFFRYPYDCSNIKSLIKCSARGVDAAPLLFSVGSVPIKELCEGFEKNELSRLPENMRKAAPEAQKAFAATKNPQLIDFILDKACFDDMDECAKKSGLPYITAMTDARADMTNFMICLRVLRMNCGDLAKDLLGQALIECGRIGKKAYLEAFARGEEGLISALERAGYRSLANKLYVGCSLAEAEKLCDNAKIEQTRDAKRKTFGAEIPIAYIAALETQIQNIRIVLAGKDAGSAPETISERIRECYV